MHLTFGYDISNELAFNKLLIDVPFMGIIRDVTKLFSEIYNMIFIGFSVFELIKHARRAGFHNPCGFVTDSQILNDKLNPIFNQLCIT